MRKIISEIGFTIKLIKSKLYSIQLFLETHSRISLTLYIIEIGLVFLFVIISIFRPKLFIGSIFTILLGIMSLITIYVDYLHFSIIRMQRRELNGRKKLIRNFLASEEPDYQYKLLQEEHRILPNGDGIYNRHVKLIYSGSNIMWYSLLLGSTNVEGDFDSLYLEAFRLPERESLPRITFHKAPRRIQTIVVLDPPLSKSNPEIELDIHVFWPGIWKKLVSENFDDGRIMINHETEFLTLVIIPPKGKKIINFKTDPQIEDCSHIVENLENELSCHCDKPPKGIYTYSFNLEKLKNH